MAAPDTRIAPQATPAARGGTPAFPGGFHALKYRLPRAFRGAGEPKTSVLETTRKATADEDPRAPMAGGMPAESGPPGLGASSWRTAVPTRTGPGIPPSRTRHPSRRKGTATAGPGNARRLAG